MLITFHFHAFFAIFKAYLATEPVSGLFYFFTIYLVHGPLEIYLVHGPLEIYLVHGPLEIFLVHGPLEIYLVHGPLEIRLPKPF